MLYVDFHKQNGVGFELIGNYFLLGDGDAGHISQLKPRVEHLFQEVFGVEHIDWEPIDQFMIDNKEQFGDYEDWEAVANNLSRDGRTAYQMAWILLKQGKATKTLSNASEVEVRNLVASFKYHLDTLIDDNNDWVRRTVAEQGYGLEVLIKDKSPIVREAVARNGYGLDVLVKDNITSVRCAVASQGYGLSTLISDPSPNVRAEVYRQGYGVDILEKDSSAIVKKAIREFNKNSK